MGSQRPRQGDLREQRPRPSRHALASEAGGPREAAAHGELQAALVVLPDQWRHGEPVGEDLLRLRPTEAASRHGRKTELPTLRYQHLTSHIYSSSSSYIYIL